MKVYDVLHISVEEIGGMYRVNADDGWCIHLPEHEKGVYKKAVALPMEYDFNTMQVIEETEISRAEEEIL